MTSFHCFAFNDFFKSAMTWTQQKSPAPLRGQLLSLPVVFATNMPSLHLILMLCIQQLYTNFQLWYQPWKPLGCHLFLMGIKRLLMQIYG